ncbi:hypothetical protein ACFOLC_00210 [Lysobacter cavernae]|uniref:Uncharacterized protein n=1 Tax=Lysobacter cavernae TaxID=1685901 RepID=A0ABV7RL26_9GAMM
MKSKGLVFILSATLLFVAGTSDVLAGRFQVTRKIVQLWTAPGDDMRPEISGTVTAVSTTGVSLEGGAIVPVTGAKVNVDDLVTFICKEIAQGSPPVMKDCELLRTQPPEQPSKSGQVELW